MENLLLKGSTINEVTKHSENPLKFWPPYKILFGLNIFGGKTNWLFARIFVGFVAIIGKPRVKNYKYQCWISFCFFFFILEVQQTEPKAFFIHTSFKTQSRNIGLLYGIGTTCKLQMATRTNLGVAKATLKIRALDEEISPRTNLSLFYTSKKRLLDGLIA